jgi:hypothetical protein
MQGPFATIAIRFAALCTALLWIPAASAATCQFNQVSGAWNVPANWNGCGTGNGVPAGTPGTGDIAEVTGGRTAALPPGTFNVGQLFLSDGTVTGTGIGASTITTGASTLTNWTGTNNTLNGMSLQLGAGAGINTGSSQLNITGAEWVTNGGTTTIGIVNVSGTGARISLQGGTAYRASGNHTLSGGAVFTNQSGVFTAINSLTFNGPFNNGGNLEIPPGVTFTVTQPALYAHTSPVFSLIFGGGTFSAPGQTLTLAMGGVRGSPGPGLTFNVGVLNNTGAILRPSPSTGVVGLINISGGLTFGASGSAEFTFNGTTPAQIDRIIVAGLLTGTATIFGKALGNFAPVVGTTLDVMPAATIMSFSVSFNGVSLSFDAPRTMAVQFPASTLQFVVNGTTWVVSDPGDAGTVAPTLRNALNTLGAEACINQPYAIHFNLPMGMTTIQPVSSLPAISCPNVLIDGYTQPGSSLNTSNTDWNGVLNVDLDGSSCAGCDGLTLLGQATVKGLNVRNWTGGVRINSSAAGTTVIGNYFFQNGFGVYHDGANNINVGVPGPPNRNVFVHSTTAGIASLNAGGTASSFVNNLIGAGAGLTPGPNVKGIHILNTNDATINNNIVVFNGKGIVVGSGVRNSIYANKINGNTTIGIDLDDDGPTANDEAMPPYDTDNGGNQLLNFPVISSITQTGLSTGNVNFTLKSTPSSDVNVCICVNATGGSQCQLEIGCTPYTTNASGLISGAIAATGMTAGTSTVTAYTRALTGTKAGNSSELSPAVTFAAAAPAVSITGTSAFPSTMVSTSSAVQAITITNTGTGPLSISGITNSGAPIFVDTTSGPAPNAAHYCGFGSNAMGQPQTGMPIVIPAMGTCVLNLIFAPGATGAASGVITITSNAPASPHTVNLSGTGTAAGGPIFSPSATMLNFPAQTVGGASTAQTITITNTGSIGLTFGVSSIGGPFAISGNTCTGLAPAATCTVSVTFNPTATGAATGSLTMNTNAAASPHLIALAGSGIAPTTSFTPTAINHGSVAVGSSGTITGTFANTSPVTITLGNPFATPGAASFAITGGMVAPCTNGMMLPTMTGCTFTSTFTPAAAGMISNAYTFDFTAGAQTFNPTVVVDGTGVAAASPTMTVSFSPTSVLTGVNSTLTITITNSSAMAATLGTGTAIPFGSLFFASTASDSCGLGATNGGTFVGIPAGGVIPPSSSCTQTHLFSSATPGSYPVNVTPGSLVTSLGNNANTSSTTLTVTAAPTPTLTVAFAPTTVNTGVDSTLTFTLTNPSASAAGITLGSSVTVSGLTMSALTDSCSLGAFISTGSVDFGMAGLLPAMSTCTVTVQVQSATPGMYPVTVIPGNLITNRGNNANTSSATLTVVATAPAVVLSSPSAGFGSRTVNTTSPAAVITLTNGGTANLVIIGITISGDFGFTTTCPISTPPIAPAATCNLSITFTPLTVAALTGTLTITSNAPGSPHTIALTGTGLAVAAPAIAVSTTTLNLGATVINTTSPQQSIVITNTGFANLNISAITISGAGFARVTPSTGTPVNCATSVAPSSTCQIAITCTPTATGIRSGQVSITHNATGSPTLINLACTGNTLPVAVIALSSAIDFGDQVISTTSTTRNVTISNTGTATMNVSSISITGANANQFSQTGSCTSVPAGGTCALIVTFTPTTVGAKSATITITSDAQNAASANSIALTGNGVLAPRPIASPSVTAIGFGNTIFGGASASQLVTFKNDGGLAMSISGIVATGDFTQMSNCGTSVASLASCLINVSFNPLGTGYRAGELQVFTNAQGSPHRVLLSGTGCRWFSQANNRFFLTAC